MALTALPSKPETMASAISVWTTTSGDLSMKISYSMTCSGVSEIIDKIVDSNNLLMLRIKGKAIKDEGKIKFGFSFSLSKPKCAKRRTLKINISSIDLECLIENVNVPENWSEWQDMGWYEPVDENCLFSSLLTIIVTVIEEQKDTISSKLHTDKDFVDFSLATDDGSVAVHRAYLAANSDVFKAMLTKQWRESSKGQITMEGVTVLTLQHLKDYMYLGILPSSAIWLKPLLLLARIYVIEDLEKKCIKKLSETVPANELFSLVRFACDKNIPELIYALLVVAQDSDITIAHELHRKLLEEKCQVKEQK